MSIEKVKAWTKKHWKKLAVGGGVIVGGTLVYLGFKSGQATKFIGKIVENASYNRVGEVTDKLSEYASDVYKCNEGDWVDIWTKAGIDGIPIEDLGKFGEAISEYNPNFNRVAGIVTAYTKTVESDG